MARIGDLMVRIGADVAGLHRGSQQAVGSIATIERRVQQLTRLLGALAGAFVIRQMGRFISDGLRAVDAQAKLARRLDATIDGLRGIQIAAGDAGVSQEDLTSSLEQLNVRLGQAERNTGTAVDALRALRLEADDLAGMDLDERMATIADRIASMGLSSAQAADLLRQLGIRSGEVVNLMRQGGDAIRAAREELEAYGLSISEIDAARVEAANDEMERLGRVMQGVRDQIAVGMAPAIGEVARTLNEVARQHGGWADVAAQATQSIVRGAGYILEALGSIVNYVEAVPSTVGMGLLGKLLFGNRGLAVFAGLGLIIDTLVLSELEEVDRALQNARDSFDQANVAMLAARTALLVPRDAGTTSRLQADLERFTATSREASAAILELTVRRNQLVDEAGNNASFGDMLVDTGRALQHIDLSFLSDIPALAAPAITAITDLGEAMDEAAKADSGDAKIQAMRDRLAAVMEFLAAEGLAREGAHAVEQQQHAERMIALKEAFGAEIIAAEEFHRQREALEEGHQQRLADLRRMATLSTLNEVSGMFGALADVAQAGGERTFKVMKQLKIAEALVNTGAAIMQIWADPSNPTIWGKIAATVAASARMLSTIAQMRSVTPQGGGSVTAGGGGGAPAQSAGPTQERVLVVRGIDRRSLFSGDMVLDLMGQMHQAQKDGYRLVPVPG